MADIETLKLNIILFDNLEFFLYFHYGILTVLIIINN